MHCPHAKESTESSTHATRYKWHTPIARAIRQLFIQYYRENTNTPTYIHCVSTINVFCLFRSAKIDRDFVVQTVFFLLLNHVLDIFDGYRDINIERTVLVISKTIFTRTETCCPSTYEAIILTNAFINDNNPPNCLQFV